MRFIQIIALFAASGCSLILNNDSAQCVTDEDCVRFGGHPFCQNGVCVPSGLGPEGCTVTKTGKQTDYLNACSAASCVPFDNCGRLGLCGTKPTAPATVDPTNASI